MPLNSSRKSASSRWLGAAARAFVPVGGPIIANHLDNFASMGVELPFWNRPFPSERVLILSPHPDDETLGCGGFIQRCVQNEIPVKVAFLTNGDGSRTTQLVLNAKNPLRRDKSLFDIATSRQTEAIRAIETLGLNASDAAFLGFPDGGIREVLKRDSNNPFISPTTGNNRVEYELAQTRGASYCRESLVSVLVAVVEQFAPTLVLTTPFEDTHLDHKGAFEALELALRAANLPHKPTLATFLIHYGIWPVPNGLHPDLKLSPPAKLLNSKFEWFSFPLTASEIETKRQALSCHATQLASTPRYLQAFVRQNELFAFQNSNPEP